MANVDVCNVALALLLFFWRDWLRIVGGLVTSIRDRRIHTSDERLAWLLVAATIPVGLAGVALDHTFRTLLGRPSPAAAFLALNGLVIFAGERLRRDKGHTELAQANGDPAPAVPDLPVSGQQHPVRQYERDPNPQRPYQQQGFALAWAQPYAQQPHAQPGYGRRSAPLGGNRAAMPQEQAVAASVH